jgi:hypothetical protein
LLVFYYVMQRASRISVAAALGLISMVILLMLNHETIPQVVNALLEGSILSLILITVAAKLKPGKRGSVPSPNVS